MLCIILVGKAMSAINLWMPLVMNKYLGGMCVCLPGTSPALVH